MATNLDAGKATAVGIGTFAGAIGGAVLIALRNRISRAVTKINLVVRGLYGEEVDEDLAWKVGHAAAQFLRSLLSGYERGQAASNRLVINI